MFDGDTYRELFGSEMLEGTDWLAGYLASSSTLIERIATNAADRDRVSLDRRCNGPRPKVPQSRSGGDGCIGTELQRLPEDVQVAHRVGRDAIIRFIAIEAKQE
jgi:hypothetical protein